MGQGYRLHWLAARALLVVVAAAIAVGAARAAEPWVVEGRVVGVADGDTITLLDSAKVQHKVRIAGIDAPERGQAFGSASKESLSRLVFDRRVEVRCQKRDRYGREVRRLPRLSRRGARASEPRDGVVVSGVRARAKRRGSDRV